MESSIVSMDVQPAWIVRSASEPLRHLSSFGRARAHTSIHFRYND
jgi:hypothetical protein